MSEETKKGGSVPEGVAAQVANLLLEPFAEKHGFATQSLAAIAPILESNGISSDGAVDDTLLESFERCKSTYCLLLMELETHGLAPEQISPLQTWAKKKKAPEPPPRKAPPQLKSTPTAPAESRDEAPAEFSGPTKEFLKIGNYFLGMLDLSSRPFPREYIERLAGQNLCFAMESASQRALRGNIERFWANRQPAIQKLLSEEGSFELKPELKSALDALAKEHGPWLGEQKFPYAVVTLALRYIFARPRPQDFEPSLAEAATLVLFFGNPGPVGTWNLDNELGISGLSTAEATELAFRLYRVQRLRNVLLTSSRMPDGAYRESLPKDIKRALALVGKIRFGASGRSAAA